ncbi:MAG TPA: phenylalanine--tRNA ligase subunit beta [Methylococcus sp.]|nr:phenylalanine--tRNA ligase subunit beta [Methylococcus sp.]
MRISEAWIRQYANPPVDTAGLVHQLTMAGLEVDAVEPVAASFSGVVVARVVDTKPHPEADRLQVCRVDAGRSEPLQIVCGAANVRVGMLVPLALEGAVLPGPLVIQRTRLRGVESWGMLCSARELGLEESSSGLLELPSEAPLGCDIREYLQLEDRALEIDLTPNRADCLSVEGIAREVALLNRLPFQGLEVPEQPVESGRHKSIRMEAPEACPRYLGRVIAGVDARAPTPIWMKERLRRSGLRSLGAVIDVTNYVLLELGQPLHAFDLAKLTGEIRVRWGRAGETLALLNGEEIALTPDVLVIADDRGPLALAGVMGGDASAVRETTTDIFLESAFFAPAAILGKARRFGLATESSHRFERGVDPELPRRALQRATALIREITGGSAGPVTEVSEAERLPVRAAIRLRARRLDQVLGFAVDRDSVTDILTRLGMGVVPDPEGWTVVPPSFRFDIGLEADLIEEVGRIHGYERIPRRRSVFSIAMQPASESVLTTDRVRDLLADRGYQEVITYSFVDPELQRRIDPDSIPLALKNPISSEQSVMRTSLWVGLIEVARKNLNRQQDRLRIFETGLRFLPGQNGLGQRPALAGLALGPAFDEQWGERSRPVDFFDVKGDLEALLALTGCDSFRFESGMRPALHPGQTAVIGIEGETVGWLGMLHPELERWLGFEQAVFLFELDLDRIERRRLPRFTPLSRFPQVRRDLALVVDHAVPAAALLAAVAETGGALVRDVVLFDVYRGAGVEPEKKSVALGVVLQDARETLTDSRVEAVIEAIVERLTTEFGAKLRD